MGKIMKLRLILIDLPSWLIGQVTFKFINKTPGGTILSYIWGYHVPDFRHVYLN